MIFGSSFRDFAAQNVREALSWNNVKEFPLEYMLF